jgi:hypothetical protein
LRSPGRDLPEGFIHHHFHESNPLLVREGSYHQLILRW